MEMGIGRLSHIPLINNRLKPASRHLAPIIKKPTCNLSKKSLNLQRNINAFSVIYVGYINLKNSDYEKVFLFITHIIPRNK